MTTPASHARRPGLPTPAFWKNRKVLVTGHTGFKGSWLLVWLRSLGAEVRGYALPPEVPDSMFSALQLHEWCDHVIGDIRDLPSVSRCVQDFKPDIVLHLAGQSLMRRSYRDPIETFAVNVMGTAHVLDACRLSPPSVVLVITTDKCYRNHEWMWPYRETDELGGRDPYSASKACAELVAGAWRDSFLHEQSTAVATARSGNVIGGGDWSEDRLLPDAVRAFAHERPLVVRNPSAIRPWQHVLEPLAGYLTYVEHLSERPPTIERALNFGPPEQDRHSVADVVSSFARAWSGNPQWHAADDPFNPHEAGRLVLDSSLARHRLGWTSRLSMQQATQWSAEWYQSHGTRPSAPVLCDLTLAQIDRYAAMPEGSGAS